VRHDRCLSTYAQRSDCGVISSETAFYRNIREQIDMSSAQGRSSQTHARRRHRHAATTLPVPVPVPVPPQPGPADEAPDKPADRAPDRATDRAPDRAPDRAAAEAADQDQAAGRGGQAVDPGVLARSWAAAGYVMAALASFLPPLLIVLLSRRDSAFLRKHAVQAMNAAFTMLLYGLSAAIVACLLALDSLWLGLGIGLAAIAACWLVTFGYLIAAMIAAWRGRFYQIPPWLCAQLVRP
jgi:uncharacterized Tic20 family protein